MTKTFELVRRMSLPLTKVGKIRLAEASSGKGGDAVLGDENVVLMWRSLVNT